ncbi:methylated-DNA--[protein]-cysteine S-methyltransferase [Neiella marina]|uniref:Methylated-DNA--protein-cysteine methyltransferase n=2 Tax=Neiella holothuriorum TaxID=2870530 RepID=A0ABS7EIR0_9GAMM|nr:methylated-DNA--[protein]-cysteine S-methyltransferase [Neiella holothuriorum]
MIAISDTALVDCPLIRLAFSDSFQTDSALPIGQAHHPSLLKVEQQISEYFTGKRTSFELPLAPAGTSFQQAAWRALQTIPWGQTRNYSEQAVSIGKPKAVRAVGAANGRNPIAIVIPCHRVIGSNGELTGYAGGITRKEWLLAHELHQQ